MEIKLLITIHYSGKCKTKLSEITKTQRELLMAFAVNLEGTL